MKSISNIIDTIDEVYNMTLESDISVVDAMGTACYKAGVIMENYGGDDYESLFAIFQEEDTNVQNNTASVDAAAKKEAEEAAQKNDPKKSGPLWFLINIFRKIAQWFKDAWNGKIVPTFNRAIGKAEQTEVKEEHVPLLQAIFEKPMEWIKEHKAQLGIGLAGIALISVFKIIINRMSDDSQIKKSIVALYKSIGVSITVPFKVWKWTIYNRVLAIKTDFSFNTIKEIFTEDIPNLFKTTAESLKFVREAAKDPESNAAKYSELVNKYNELGKKLATKYNGTGKESITPQEVKELKATFNAIQSFHKEASPLMQDLTGRVFDENNVDTKINGLTADLSGSLRKIDEKLGKGQDSLMKCFEKTTIIGGAVGAVMNLFSGLTKNMSEANKIVEKLADSIKKGTMGSDEFEQVTTKPDDFDTNRIDYLFKDDNGEFISYGDDEKGKDKPFDANNCYKVIPKTEPEKEVSDEEATTETYEQVTEEPSDFNENKSNYYKKSKDENGKDVYTPYGADESFIQDNCYKVKQEQPKEEPVKTENGSTIEVEGEPLTEEAFNNTDKNLLAIKGDDGKFSKLGEGQTFAADKIYKIKQTPAPEEPPETAPEDHGESYYEDSTDDVVSESWYNKF